MLQKLILFVITAIFLTGCGASAPAETVASASAEGSILHRADQAEQVPMEAPAGSSLADTETAAAAETFGAAEYFLFTTASNTLTDDAGNTILYETYSVPSFVSGDEGRTEWVNGVLEDIARNFATDSRNLFDYAKEFLELNGTEGFYSHSNYQELGVARHDERVVSLLCLSSLYSGGVHPNSVQVAYNLDITGQRVLKLEDVLAEGAEAALAVMVREAVDAKFAGLGEGMGLFEDYGDVIARSMTPGSLTPYWYLNDVGLVIFYNQYELGPYAAGIIKAELPYEALEGILLEEYFPMEPDGVPGDLLLRGDIAGRNAIPITIAPEGQTLLVGVEGTVHQVQLSEVMWLEDTPIAQDLLFSALTMGQNDILEITGGYDDAARSFAIEFVNGAGEHRIYYLHEGELSEEP